MTKEEHLLVLSIFVKQAQWVNMVHAMLKSRGIIEADDLPAFDFSTRLDIPANVSLFEQVKASYIQLAKGLRIETGLENLPPASEKDFSPRP
jgi:hypothetical protein